MALKLMYITNNKDVAMIAETSGVDRIFVDLEINGKEDRQGHLNSVISHHNIEDVKIIRNVLKKSELLVRVNPIYDGSEEEIDRVINDGADIVMLPFFKSKKEVDAFIRYVRGRARTCLLWETKEAVDNIDVILNTNGIDEIHIGLNDLHLSYGKKFMFELLCDGTVETLCDKFKTRGIPYGFGGIARIGKGDLPAEKIIIEHYNLGSTMVILSRGFCNIAKITDLNTVRELFRDGVAGIRNFEEELQKRLNYFIDNKKEIKNIVANLISINAGEIHCEEHRIIKKYA